MTTEPEHTGLPVHGYQTQPQTRIDIVNENKVQEEELLRKLDGMLVVPHEFDARWIAIARTHFEQGFMALNRAVFRPARVDLEQMAKAQRDGA